MVASTTNRVESNSIESNTEAGITDRIREEMRERLARFETANLNEISYRLAELDQELDVERLLQTGFASVVLGGITLTTFRKRKWLVLPFVAGCFMMMQVLEGWCPPLLVLRRLGFRTKAEINRERTALKVLRGDFAHLGIPSAQSGMACQESLLDAIEQ